MYKRQASDNGTLKEQKSGTFYDLLPKGMYVDVGKIKVTTVYRQGGTTFLPDKDVYKRQYCL